MLQIARWLRRREAQQEGVSAGWSGGTTAPGRVRGRVRIGGAVPQAPSAATWAAMIIRCASEVPATISSARASRSSRSTVVPRR